MFIKVSQSILIRNIFWFIPVMNFSGYSALSSRISEPLKLYEDPNTKLNENWTKANYEFYKKGNVYIIKLNTKSLVIANLQQTESN